MRRPDKTELEFLILAVIAIPPAIYQTMRFLFSLAGGAGG